MTESPHYSTRRLATEWLVVALLVASTSSCAHSGAVAGATPQRRTTEASDEASEEGRRRVVVLVHGLFRSTRSMRPLHDALEVAGFEPYPYRYYSTRDTVEAHGQEFARELARLQEDVTIETIHVVTHSLGGVVTRAALTHGRPSKLQRVVMLAPPNQGSEVATTFAPYFGALIRPLQEVTHDRSQRRGKLLDSPAYPGVEVGVIAGLHDPTVALALTHLEGEKDHVVIDCGHTFIMNNKDTQRQVVHFLLTGGFRRQAAELGTPRGL